MTRPNQHFECSIQALRTLVSVAAALVSTLAASGCANHDTVLANVGTRVITRAEFEAAAATNASQYQDTPERAKRRLLADMIKRDLLLLVADQRGLTHNPMTQTYRRTIEEQVLSAAVTDQITPRNVPVTDAEIEEFYAWSQISAHLQVMYSPDRAMIDAALDRLRAGHPFEEVAQQVTPAGLLPPGGDLGEVTVGTLVDPLDEFARTAPVGRLVGPVTGTGEGWFVARVISRHAVPAPAPLQVMRGQLANMLRQRKLRMIAARGYLTLRDQYRIVLEPGGPEALYSYANGGQPAPDGTTPPPPDPATVLARYSDATGREITYTLGEAAVDLRRTDRDRPDVSGTPTLRLWIGQSVVQRVLLLEAHRRGLDRDPQTVKRVDSAVENGVLETVYNDEVSQAVSATPEDVQHAYEMQSSQFPKLNAAEVQSITLADSAAAVELTRHGGHAPSLMDAAKMLGLEAHVTQERVTFPNGDPTWQALQSEVLMMSRGEWAGPMHVPGGWRVFEVLEKETETTPFDQLSASERQALQQFAVEMKREQRLTAVTDSLGRVTRPFEVHDGALNAIPWPGAPPPGN